MPGSILVAHHGAEMYGSDRQLLESVEGLLEGGWKVTVAVPSDGVLCEELRARGADVRVLRFPVLRRAEMSLSRLPRMLLEAARAVRPALNVLRRSDAELVYVNTLILPFWILVGRLAHLPVLCHVHEAYERGPRLIRATLAGQLLLVDRVVVNSRASRDALRQAWRRTAKNAEVVYNGVPGPEVAEPIRSRGDRPSRIALIGRLSPNKGTDIALEAIRMLISEGRSVELDLIGGIYPGYEWFEQELRLSAGRPALRAKVHFEGFQATPWPALAQCDIAIVPSRFEPFGNTAVEAQLARRPVVVARTQGLTEIVDDGETGLVVEAEDPIALAHAIASLLDDPDTALALAEAGYHSAAQRFAVATYRRTICCIVASLSGAAGHHAQSPDGDVAVTTTSPTDVEYDRPTTEQDET